jgi:Arm domain-containing DNA-binding protein
VLVKPNGVRLWRFKYVLAAREKLISLGDYRDVPLRRAREKRDEAHIDSRRRSRQKLLTGICGDFGNTFYLSLGRKPVCTIAAPELLAVLREFEIRRHPTVSADVLPEPEKPVNLGDSVSNPTTPAADAFGGQGMSASRECGSTFAGRRLVIGRLPLLYVL